MEQVLIVDDERLLLNSLAKYLSIENIDVKTVETGNDALKEISSSLYPLCFLDINLPDINGLDVMKKMKELSPQTKVVIMTAQYVTDEMKKEIEGSADYFIAKPFDLMHIKTIVEAVLGDNKNALPIPPLIKEGLGGYIFGTTSSKK